MGGFHCVPDLLASLAAKQRLEGTELSVQMMLFSSVQFTLQVTKVMLKTFVVCA